MQWSTWLGITLAVVGVMGTKIGPPPVILDLGPVVPTPVPTPQKADKKRLITTITVQNNAAGETVITFEATDVADEGEGKSRMIAAKSYSVAESEEKSALKPLANKIVGAVRDLERDMLEFVEISGPPKPRAPMSQSGGAAPPR